MEPGEYERTLQEYAHVVDNVKALAVWEDRLNSGHWDRKVRVRNVATGECEQVLEGHNGGVRVLAVCGSRLASGCGDGSIKV